MSYNPKNKNVVILALTFAVMMTISKAGKAEDAAPFLFDEQANAVANEVTEAVKDNTTQALIAAEEATEKTVEALQDTTQTVAADIDVAAENIKKATDTLQEDLLFAEKIGDEQKELLSEEKAKLEALLPEETENASFLDEAPVKEVEEVKEENPLLAEDTSALFAGEDSDVTEPTELEDENDAIVAPSSPFENFGNSVLSKVDNDLFNQMSKIEKQTTILNLELKREDVRNKVEALRAARELAKQEAEARRIQEEQRIKDLEAERQAKILAAEEKLRQKEIELEKVRQGKVLNDYMNQMLVMNQKWIEKNSVMQNRIRELEDERKGLIETFEGKVNDVKMRAETLNVHASEAVEKYKTSLKTLNEQITSLRKDIEESEARIQQMREQASRNPFGKGNNLDPNAASTDLAMEYAIMDITGRGDNILAKLVSRDGTTFTVHQGSVLRGGETVLKITEKYIAFDKKGMKAYLYPGGTIMEYEPVNIFNEAEKTPLSTEKQSFRPDDTIYVERAFGKPMNTRTDKKSKSDRKGKDDFEKPHKTESMSFSQGMFVK